jgi:hypothetical protein
VKKLTQTFPNQSAPRLSLKIPGGKQVLVLVLVWLLSLTISACSADFLSFPQPAAETPISQPTPTPAPIEDTPKTQVNFQVSVPENTPPESQVYLTILDEVSGLALNPDQHTMNDAELSGEGSEKRFTLSLALPVGATVKYRYERQSAGANVVEHNSDGRPVRYRVYHVEGPGSIQDVVSRWTDTGFISPTGRIKGVVKDAANGGSIPGLLVTAGGAQTFTAADGTFLLEGLPPGVHNLVAYALDGTYRTFQQGAKVAAESTTPADIQMAPAKLVDVVFVVEMPEDTPPVVPVRLAGSLYQTGNTFANLSGGVSTLADRMPILQRLPDGRASLTLRLPAGANLNYKYTLGDGFWNAEYTSNGKMRLRNIVVPEQNTLVEDQVESWQPRQRTPITFDLRAPAGIPADSSIAIQFGPVFGWTEPIPIWRLGEDRWAYMLYSPLNLPGQLNYRYCLNGLCGPENGFSASQAIMMDDPQSVYEDRITEFPSQDSEQPEDLTFLENLPAPGSNFMGGVELQPVYHPSWNSMLAGVLPDIANLQADWLVFSPTWTYTEVAPPVLEPVPGQDPLWQDMSQLLLESQSDGLQVALNPRTHFPSGWQEYWQSAPRDFSWWLVWFEQYQSFVVNYASLAESTQSPALILGGDWITPALPAGNLPDGTPSGVPADAEQRWRDLFSKVRERFTGQIFWAISAQDMGSPPPFLDAIDKIYLTYSGAAPDAEPADTSMSSTDFINRLDSVVRPIQLLYAKPLVLAVEIPSGGNWQTQAETYRSLISVAAQREWIEGLISRGFSPLLNDQDGSASVYGKPAAQLLQAWFSQIPTETGGQNP